MAIQFDDHFFSLAKRRQIQDILALIFEDAGEEDAAEIAKSTTRLTAAAIDRMRKALTQEIEEEVKEEVDESQEYGDEEEGVEEDDEYEATLHGKVEKLIKKGKFKKALKKIKEMRKDGYGGSILDGYEAQAKEGK